MHPDGRGQNGHATFRRLEKSLTLHGQNEKAAVVYMANLPLYDIMELLRKIIWTYGTMLNM